MPTELRGVGISVSKLQPVRPHPGQLLGLKRMRPTEAAGPAVAKLARAARSATEGAVGGAAEGTAELQDNEWMEYSTEELATMLDLDLAALQHSRVECDEPESTLQSALQSLQVAILLMSQLCDNCVSTATRGRGGCQDGAGSGSAMGEARTIFASESSHQGCCVVDLCVGCRGLMVHQM